MKKIIQGSSVIAVFLLACAISMAVIMESYPLQMDQYFGTVSSTREYVAIEGEDTEDPWTFKSKFRSAKDAIEGFKEFAIREAKETFVLLKNNENALPISKTAKITMFGIRSYAPVYGNSAGSIADKNTIDTYQTQIYNAFAEKGFQLNPSMLNTYKSYFDAQEWGGRGFGATPPEYSVVTKTNEVSEFSPAELENLNPNFRQDYSAYGDAAVVILGRPGGESKNYFLDDQGDNTTTGNIMGLSTKEKGILNEAKSNFSKVIVLINSVTTMEFKELKDDDGIDAIMWIGFPGAYGFYALADVLNGTDAPSAYLTDTHPTNNLANPAMKNYGNSTPWIAPEGVEFVGSDNVNSYIVAAEGIYSGYRYYETRYAETVYGNSSARNAKAGTYTAPDHRIATTDGLWNYSHEVVYPFGYGISYTTFTEEITYFRITGDKKKAEVHVKVKNTGNVAAKHAVQLYAQSPYTEYDKTNKVEKSAIQLLDYEKSALIKPGEEETVVINVEMENLAAYDYTGAKTYVLDVGKYYFTVGNGAHDALNNILAAQGKGVSDGMDAPGNAEKVEVWENGEFDSSTFAFSETGKKITNVLSEGMYAMDANAFYPNAVTYMTRGNFDGSYPKTYSGFVPTAEMVKYLKNDFIELKKNETPDYEFGKQSSLNLVDLKGADWDDPRWEELVSKVTLAEFMDFASHAFHNLQNIDSVGLPKWNADDGPGGSDTHYFNEGTYQGVAYADAPDYAVSKPGTRVCPSPQNLAASFNKELAFENGEIILGETSLILQLPIMIGPGGNLHRHGYNGRGGEYYSEDPILSGYTGSAVVQGAQSKGVLVNIKHAAFNDQEINRSGIAVFMNEQTARELELRNLNKMFTAKGKPSKFVNDSTKEGAYKEGALGVMTSYNRIGIVASSANKSVMVDIMREEWGFKGYNVTDFTGVSPKAAPKESIIFGTTAFCGFGASDPYWKEDILSGDKTLMNAVHQNVKYILYSISHSNALNGQSSGTKVVVKPLMTWWRGTYISLIVVFSFAALAGIGLTVFYTFFKKGGIKK